MRNLGWCAKVALLLWVATVVASAQTFETLVILDSTNGSLPFAAPIQGIDGNYYGTTSQGGSYNGGTVFKVTPTGTLTTLYSFCFQAGCSDGFLSTASLAQAANGDLYGTTAMGGAFSRGTVFKITPAGTLTTLYSFCANNSTCPDGAFPYAGLVQATNGSFYGMTQQGGAGAGLGTDGGGTIFQITPRGKLTTLYSFCSLAGCADGGNPLAGLLQATDGNFYGTTYAGGDLGCVVPGIGSYRYGCGTAFKITPQGKLTTLHTFCVQANCPDGAFPYAGLVQAANGNFYGTTEYGGSEVVCVISESNESCGTAFEITPGGTLTTLHSFCSQNPPTCDDGFFPIGQLTLGSDGNLYGTTGGNNGGNGEANSNSYGTIFQITPTGTLTTVHSFCQDNPPYCADGSGPLSSPTQGTNGIFFGTTERGGGTASGYGTVYSLATGLAPFVETVPASAIEGLKVSILGQGFTSASKVTFGGTQATTVTFNGSSNLVAAVPAGALTGTVIVTTGGNSLDSNQKFLVLPQVLSFSPTSGAVGTQVKITGTGFLQGLGVGFGDTVPATHFKVVSDTEVTADVPSGAKTGPVGIETKGGIGISKQVFTVSQ